MLFKQHILSFIEYRTPGIVHAATSVLQPLDNVLTKFLDDIGMTQLEALLHFNLAPLHVRRDIAMLGVIHRATLDMGAPALKSFFPKGTPPVRLGGRKWHSKFVQDNYSAHRRDYLDRSVVGYIWVYNLLNERIIEATTVQEFQRRCQSFICARASQTNWKDTFSCRVPRHSHPLR